MRDDQLICLNLLSRLLSQQQAVCLVRMYAGIKEKFNSLPRERLGAANNFKCEWRDVTWIAFLPSFSNYFVVSTSQNKSVTQLDVFLLILCFYRFFGSICGGIWGFSFAKSTTNRYFALIGRESTKARDAEIKLFSVLR